MTDQQVLKKILHRFYGFEATLQETYRLAQECANLEGDFVECGVAMGSSIIAMHLAAKTKTVWGYDSFEGIQLAGRHDEYQPGFGDKLDPNRELPADLLVSSGITAHRRTDVENHIIELNLPFERFRLVEGWVQNTLPLPENQPGAIAMLRLDMDMHDPTVVAMDYLWDKLVPGGILIIDDWGYVGVQKAIADHFKKVGYVPKWQTPDHTGWLKK